VKAKTGDDYLFEITCFLIASAERTLGPERNYGACRLVQTLYMLSFLPEHTDMKGNELLMKVRTYVDSDPQNFWREPQLKQFLTELSQQLAKQIKEQKKLK
jgi:hypothetical protein